MRKKVIGKWGMMINCRLEREPEHDPEREAPTVIRRASLRNPPKLFCGEGG